MKLFQTQEKFHFRPYVGLGGSRHDSLHISQEIHRYFWPFTSWLKWPTGLLGADVGNSNKVRQWKLPGRDGPLLSIAPILKSQKVKVDSQTSEPTLCELNQTQSVDLIICLLVCLLSPLASEPLEGKDSDQSFVFSSSNLPLPFPPPPATSCFWHSVLRAFMKYTESKSCLCSCWYADLSPHTKLYLRYRVECNAPRGHLGPCSSGGFQEDFPKHRSWVQNCREASKEQSYAFSIQSFPFT